MGDREGARVCPACGEDRLVEVEGRTAYCNVCATTFQVTIGLSVADSPDWDSGRSPRPER